MKAKLVEISMVIGILLTVMVSCLVEFKSTYDDLQEKRPKNAHISKFR